MDFLRHINNATVPVTLDQVSQWRLAGRRPSPNFRILKYKFCFLSISVDTVCGENETKMFFCNIFYKTQIILMNSSNLTVVLSQTFQTQLENMAIANALQLEAARATPALSRFNYDAMPSLTSLNLSIAVL